MSMFNAQIYISKITHLLSGVIFRFLPNLRRFGRFEDFKASKVWKKQKYNSR